MRILVVTAGSRGDVAPYTGLGQRLQRAGHRVAVAAHDRFAGLVRESGLEHRPLPGDPVELTRARTAAPGPQAARSVFAAFLDELGEGVLAAMAAGTDLVLTASGPAPLSRLAARGLGIPSAGVYLAPGVPTRAFPPPGWPGTGSSADNLAAGRELLTRSGSLYAGALRHLQVRLGLPAAPGAGPPDDWPVFHGFSPAVVPRPADWPASVHVTGYWWPAAPPGWRPPEVLTDFLAAGPPPVFIGFGSMTPEREGLDEVVAAAVARAGVRAVVQAGWAGLRVAGGDILMVGEVPHEWLFPRTAAVVHHAGAGTTAAGLRAGVPAVPVPVLVDQPFWADRLHRLGVAPEPLPLAELTADALAGALRSCLDRPEHRDRATELARRIRAEDGAAAVVSFVERLGAPLPPAGAGGGDAPD
ncbi:glycosyltransferase [Couchioplanes caeruleus]|uniref:glycosyltransferase n=1 Tax=Couchioplanes caeruleus TaxID=56438 RepID=UPI0020C13854|nr:glycosyltransferase [Couchioplanes caeruleus]UQU67871.1 glycosyltransferase [Couchioplanes caeruleus]